MKLKMLRLVLLVLLALRFAASAQAVEFSGPLPFDLDGDQVVSVPLPDVEANSEENATSDIVTDSTTENQIFSSDILAGMIFFMGVSAGLAFIKILFDRVRVV